MSEFWASDATDRGAKPSDCESVLSRCPHRRCQAVLGVVVLDLHDVVADTESQPETLDGSPRLVHSVLDAEGPGAEATPVSWAGPRSAVAIGLRGGLRSLHCVRRSAAELAPMSSTTRQARWRRSTGASSASAIGMRDGPIPIRRRGPRTSGIAAIKSRAKYPASLHILGDSGSSPLSTSS